MQRIVYLVAAAGLAAATAWGQHQDKFRQLDEVWPTPTSLRTASGAPGPDYWQQQVDYAIDVRLDEDTHRVTGSERITYHNNSPDTLTYLWVQLDQNNFDPNSRRRLASTVRESRRHPTLTGDEVSIDTLERMLVPEEFDGGFKITRVETASGNPLSHVVNDTMMRIDLPQPLRPGQTFVFDIDWNYLVVDSRSIWARSGREYFEDDGNWLYEVAQWFPRLAVYDDVNGWQNKPFIDSEFALEFGDYVVRITVPDDHIVAATGELMNPREVLTPEQRDRLQRARTADSPVYIVTPEEAKANESSAPEDEKTWVFEAESVRDFAWASSRKFIWDAQGHRLGDNFTMAMSFWPKEGEPLWSQYSTHAIMQTLDVYGRVAFPMPYPVMISVSGPVSGMEYPMMTFNRARPEQDGTYGERTKYGLISVIIHEVGHSWFPMIVNSDERQWTWMDEGVNTFVQFLAEQEWEDEYPSRRGEPRDLLSYFRDPGKVPIMTDGDSVPQLGNNAYGKTAVALNVLRETVLGRELFDYAFKEYATRWMFKRPQPADFFRTIEDASGMDLDWFWRGWFYSTDATDIAIASVTHYTMDTGDPDEKAERDRKEKAEEPPSVTRMRNETITKRVEKHPELLDFYNEYDEFEVFDEDREKFQKLLKNLDERQRRLLETAKHFYTVDLVNEGGLIMPVILQVNYEDGTSEIFRYPAETWRYDNKKVSKLVLSDKKIASFQVDPYLETGDIDMDDNRFPPEIKEKRFRVNLEETERKNPMQKALEREVEEPATEPEVEEVPN